MTPEELTMSKFPALTPGGFAHTSPKTDTYNCIAWAAEDDTKWWWPEGGYWPAGVQRELTLEAFQAAYETLGYTACADGALEQGFKKIAIFATNQPTHAAIQLADGQWSSKLGRWVDLSHPLDGLDGTEYGAPAVFMKKPDGAHAV